MYKKKIQDEELPHELFLKNREKTIIRTTFANNMSTDIKLRKAQTSKIILFGESLDSLLGNLGEKLLTNVAIPFTEDNLPRLVSTIASNAINKCERKV